MYVCVQHRKPEYMEQKSVGCVVDIKSVFLAGRASSLPVMRMRDYDDAVILMSVCVL